MKKISAKEIILKFTKEKKFMVCEQQLYVAEAGYWRRIPFEEMQKCMRRHLSEEENLEISSSMLTEVYRRMIADVAFEIPIEKVLHKDAILCNNGRVDLKTCRLVTGEPKPHFLYQSRFSFNPQVKAENAPTFQRFLESSLGNDKKKWKLLLQILGYCLTDVPLAEVFFVLLGKPGTGKSVILKLLGRVVGEENTTAIPFTRLGSRFNVGRLAGMKLNICTELSGGKMKNLDIIKAIISGERIMGEFKGETPFEFIPRVKLICAGNIFPQISETTGSDAILRRLVVLRFTEKVTEENRDLELLEKLWQEKDVIFSLALQELFELTKIKFRFAVPEDSNDFINDLKVGNEAVEMFVNENCEFSENNRIHVCALWEAFQKFTEENAIEIKITQTQFSQEIGLLEGVKRTRFRENGKSLRGFSGIALRREEPIGYRKIFPLQTEKTVERSGTGTERKNQLRQDSRLASTESKEDRKCNERTGSR